jgi:hypothetical protein
MIRFYLFSMGWIKIILNDYGFMRLLNQKNLINHFDICQKRLHGIYVIGINRKISISLFGKIEFKEYLDTLFWVLKQ